MCCLHVPAGNERQQLRLKEQRRPLALAFLSLILLLPQLWQKDVEKALQLLVHSNKC